MSVAVRSYQSRLFGQEARSDCTLEFSCGDEDVAGRASKRKKKNDGTHHASPGEALPAHLLVVCPGSAYFEAQAERWAKEHDGKPVLRVQLNNADDLPHAKAAVKYMYTGQLDDGLTAEGLLRLRRTAAFLQVEGCVEACDSALLAMVTSSAQPSSCQLSYASELYACRHLLPSAGDDPAAAALCAAVLNAVRKEVAAQAGKSGDAGSAAAPLAALLAWAFPSAPAVLNDPEALRQLQALPAPGLEALLGSEAFTTDSEDSVLLLLAYWVDANPICAKPAFEKLCHLIRLSQLSDAFRNALLPMLKWFPLDADLHRVVCTYATARGGVRRKLSGDWRLYKHRATSWFTDAARPQPSQAPRGERYEWFVTEQSLTAAHAVEKHIVSVPCTFLAAGQATHECVIRNGLAWRVQLLELRDLRRFDVSLLCSLPPPFRRFEQVLDWLPRSVPPGPCRLTLWRAQEGAGVREQLTAETGEEDLCLVLNVRVPAEPKLESKQQPQQQTGADAWPDNYAAYRSEGRISGTVVWI